MYTSFTKNRVRTFWIITVVFGLALVGTFATKSRVSFAFITDYTSRKSLNRDLAYANMSFETFSYRLRMSDFRSAQVAQLEPGVPSAGGPIVSVADANANSTTDVMTNANVPAVPVLLYHGILTTSDGVNITANTLWDQLYALKQAGYYTITLQQFEDYLNGKTVLAGKPFLLTFDDGRNDSFYNGDPIIHALGYNAVMFDISGRIDHSSFSLDSADLLSMQYSGRWDIESHTRNGHDAGYPIGPNGKGGDFFSNLLWIASSSRLETPEEYQTRVTDDVAGVKSDLQKLLDKPVTAFAYPFGDFGQESQNYPNATNALLNIMSQYYDVTFYQAQSDQGPIYNYPIAVYGQHTNPILARRIEPKAGWNGQDLLAYLDKVSPKPLPFSDDFTSDNGWIASWGSIGLGQGMLNLRSTASSTGSSAVLQGSHGWNDYRMDVSANWNPSQSISLLGRFADEKNNVDCNFSVGGVRIRETINGKETEVIETKLPVPMTKNNSVLGISVVGNTVKCYLNGKAVSSARYTNPGSPTGGVAISVWSPTLDTAGAEVKNVTILPL